MVEFSIIVPTYNEEENLLVLFKRIEEKRKQFNWDCELIISNGASIDNTREVAEGLAKKNKWVRVIHRKKGIKGMGIGLKDGTRIAKGKFVVWVMADLSDNLNSINAFMEKLREGCDIVFGSRYMSKEKNELPFIKKLLSFGYSYTTKIVFGIKVHDITNAFRGFKRNIFNGLNIESNDFAISPEMAIKAHLRGLKLCEVPTTFSKRTKGKAKFSLLKMGISYSRLFKYRFGFK